MSTKSELIEQGRHLVDVMNDVNRDLSEKRSLQAAAKIDFKRSEEALSKRTRDATIAIMSNEVISQGIKTQPEEWQKWYIDRELEKDTAWLSTFTKYSDLQADLYSLEVELIDLSEKLGTLKSQARLLSSMLLLMSEDTDGSA